MATRPLRLCALAGWLFCGCIGVGAQQQPPLAGVPSVGGQLLLQAATDPPRLLVLTPDLAVLRVIPAQTLHRQAALAVAGIWALPKRKGWLVALQGVPELWEISHDPKAPDIHDGYVHDYRMGESIATPGFLGVRRVQLDSPAHVLGIDQTQAQVLVMADVAGVQPKTQPPQPAPCMAEVIHLDIRRRTVQLALPCPPALDNATAVVSDTPGKLCMAAQNPAHTLCLGTAPWRVLEATVPR